MPPERLPISRRYWLRHLTLSLAGSAGLLARRQTLSTAPLMSAQDFAQYPDLLTPNSDFFVRNHFAQPAIDLSNWTLRIEGAVKNPKTLRYGDLKSRKSRTLTAVLECAGNGVGEGAVGCAAWSGPALGELLRECGLESGAHYVRFIAADRGVEPGAAAEMPYTRSITIDEAMAPETLLATQMNGAQLPAENGFPIRLLRAGIYGMDSVKWLEKIEVISSPDKSFFNAHRYLRTTGATSDDTATRVSAVQIKSIIVKPVEAAIVHGPTLEIGGYAWAGQEKIRRVEVTMDNGKSWRPSQLLAESRLYEWVPWKLLWERVQPGLQTIAVRAWGESDSVQPARRSPERLDRYELNHYHRVSFKVIS